MRLIHIDDGDALNIDCVVANKVDSKDCKCFYSCDLIDQYEARLKADMVAILVELQLEIEELDTPNNGSAYMDCVDIIQQKINSLKEQKNGNNN